MRHANAPLLLLLACCVGAPTAPPALRTVEEDLVPFVERQLKEQGIRGASIAVLDVDPATGSERIWRRGFGAFDESGRAMPHDAVFRVASISKLFTDTAAMALVEQKKLDLDAPVSQLVPEFVERPQHETRVTLRRLMSHRAGIVRESVVGHYFDPTEPSLEATVASLSQSDLVWAPGASFKYSNPGIGLVGLAVARAHGKPFEDSVRELVLDPLGLRDSDFAPRADLVARVPHGDMWTYDGRAIPTPRFAFGYAPAANLRSTTLDLVAFARSWFPSSERRVLSKATQESMWALREGKTSGCSLGFFVRDFDGHRCVGHDGAVYGFASCLQALPEQGIAVAVVCTKDFANGISEAITDRALRAALAARRGERLPAPSYPQPVGKDEALRLSGFWRCGKDHVWLLERDGELYYDPNVGVRTRLRRAADGSLVADDTLGVDTGRRLSILDNGNLHDGAVEYVRDENEPAPPPPEMLPLLGEYGWDHNVLVVHEDRGKLAVLIEWAVRDVPEPRGGDQYLFLPGMYGGDALAFERDANGKVIAARVGGARFERRELPQPPSAGSAQQPRVVDLLPDPVPDPSVLEHIRHAHAFLARRDPTLDVVIHGTSGSAVDVALVREDGNAVDLPCPVGEDSVRALPDWSGVTARQRWFRELLRRAMREAGFEADAHRWWRFTLASSEGKDSR